MCSEWEGKCTFTSKVNPWSRGGMQIQVTGPCFLLWTRWPRGHGRWSGAPGTRTCPCPGQPAQPSPAGGWLLAMSCLMQGCGPLFPAGCPALRIGAPRPVLPPARPGPPAGPGAGGLWVHSCSRDTGGCPNPSPRPPSHREGAGWSAWRAVRAAQPHEWLLGLGTELPVSSACQGHLLSGAGDVFLGGRRTGLQAE